MKKTINFLPFFITVFLMYSCSDDNDITEPEIENYDMKFSAVYVSKENPNEVHPDIGSKVYIYYTDDLYNFKYEGSGVFVKDNLRIEPDQNGEINVHGKAIITPILLDDYLFVAIESVHFNRITVHPFISARKGVGLDLISKP